MTEHMPIAEYRRLVAQMSVSATGCVVQVAKPSPEFAATLAKASGVLTKPNKYGAKKTVVDGITFDLKLEARRYVQLTEMQRQGLIYKLLRQARYPLNASILKRSTAKQLWRSLTEDSP